MTKYYGIFDSQTGMPQGFLNDEVYVDGVGIPDDAVQITQEQWQNFINNPGVKKWDGTDVVDNIPTVTTDMLLVYAGDKKKDLETGGITIDGFSVATDRASQAMIAQTVVSLQINPNLLLDWKNPDGSFTTLTGDFVKSIAYFVSLHVSKTFTLLKDVTAKINDQTLVTKHDIDTYFDQNLNTAFSSKIV